MKKLTFHMSSGHTFSTTVDDEKRVLKWYRKNLRVCWWRTRNPVIGLIDDDGGEDFYVNIDNVDALIVGPAEEEE